MRNNIYLEERLQYIWGKYFSDVVKKNPIEIHFGKKARKRLGSIRERKCNGVSDTLIVINGHFKNPEIPENVIDATIAHELCHYAHGFGSSLPQLSKYPHRGGSVDREMERRGLGESLELEKNWLDKNWIKFLRHHH